MRGFPAIRRLLAALGLTAGLAGGAFALTVRESDMPGGSFGGSWSDPTPIGPLVDTVTGTGAGNQYDTFVFTTLAAGAQSLSFTFTAPQGVGYSYAAGGSLLYSTEPFRWGWDGTGFGSVFIGYWQQSQTVTLAFGPDFSGGPLYVALNFTFGSDLGYTVALPMIDLPPPPPPAPVPVPMGAGLLASGLAALLLPPRRRVRRRR